MLCVAQLIVKEPRTCSLGCKWMYVGHMHTCVMVVGCGGGTLEKDTGEACGGRLVGMHSSVGVSHGSFGDD